MLISDVWNFKTATFLISPPNNYWVVTNSVLFQWHRIENAESYKFELAYDEGFASPLFTDSTITDTVKFFGFLPDQMNFYWRVSAKNSTGYFLTCFWHAFCYFLIQLRFTTAKAMNWSA